MFKFSGISGYLAPLVSEVLNKLRLSLRSDKILENLRLPRLLLECLTELVSFFRFLWDCLGLTAATGVLLIAVLWPSFSDFIKFSER